MPYSIVKSSSGVHKGEYKLTKKGEKKVLGWHTSKEKAQKQIAAIEISKMKRKK